MTSTIKVNTIQDSCGSSLVAKCGANITLGASGKTVRIACGASTVGMGRTGTVDWCTTAKTSPFTGVSGKGYFVNTTSGAVTVTLPSSPSAGDIVAIKDYANTFDTNNVTIGRAGSKINGNCYCATLSTESQSVTLIYVDGTKGWQDIHDSTSDVTGFSYNSATGGTITECGDYKIHTFTSDANFVVSSVGNYNGGKVDYLVIAGGGGGGHGNSTSDRGAGGGAGGYRESGGSQAGGYTIGLPANSCVAGLPVTASTYPITVGAGGATQGSIELGNCGSPSTFSTITSTGGGGGGEYAPRCGKVGGSGGGGGGGTVTAGAAGNTPPVSPPQGNPGGQGGGGTPNVSGGGGGGASSAGTDSCGGNPGNGGSGATSSITGSAVARAGGGAGDLNGSASAGGAGGPGTCVNGTANTGGGGQGGSPGGLGNGTAGGSGIVIIRYKFQ